MARILLLLTFLASLAVAGEKATLTFADGQKKACTLVKFDEDGVTIEPDRVVPWTKLTPESGYAARKALTPFDDGAGRLGLANFARSWRLYPEAFEQLEIALALGAISEARFEESSVVWRAEEVKYLARRIDDLLLKQAPPKDTLAAIKRLKERYPVDPTTKRYEAHIKALVDQLAEQAAGAAQAQSKQKEDKALAKLREKIAKLNLRKEKALATAARLMKESERAIEKRQVSRVKKKLVEPVGAERYLKKARRYLHDMSHADKHLRIVTKAGLEKEYRSIEKDLLTCYLRVARSQLQQRNYKGAIPYVRKILLYDPINEEALEMVDDIRKNRITIKVSDLTNARGRVTGG